MKKLFILILTILCSVNYLSAQWEACNNGLWGGEIQSIVNNDSVVFAGTVNGNLFYSEDYGDSWFQIPCNPNKDKVFSFAVLITKIFVANIGGGIILSTDYGKSWKEVSNELNQYINLIAINNKMIIACKNDKMFISYDLGNKWIEININWSFKRIYSIAINGNDIFAGVNGGIHFSSDNGTTWIDKDEGIYFTLINCIVIKNNNLFVGTSDGIYFSTDYGENWTERNSNLGNRIIRSLLINDNITFAGGDGGVFVSINNGYNWKAINKGLTNLYVKSLTICGDYIFAGTIENGIFRAKLSDFGITDVEDTKPPEQSELIVYPNPANDYIEINFDRCPTSARCWTSPEIRIYNSIGECVINVEIQNFGSLRIDTSELTPGIYFLRCGGQCAKFVKM